jgi:hypothetical protein
MLFFLLFGLKAEKLTTYTGWVTGATTVMSDRGGERHHA